MPQLHRCDAAFAATEGGTQLVHHREAAFFGGVSLTALQSSFENTCSRRVRLPSVPAEIRKTPFGSMVSSSGGAWNCMPGHPDTKQEMGREPTLRNRRRSRRLLEIPRHLGVLGRTGKEDGFGVDREEPRIGGIHAVSAWTLPANRGWHPFESSPPTECLLPPRPPPASCPCFMSSVFPVTDSWSIQPVSPPRSAPRWNHSAARLRGNGSRTPPPPRGPICCSYARRWI